MDKIGKEEPGATDRIRHSSDLRFEVLEWLRQVNKRKVRLLTVAMALELGAIVLLVVVGIIVLGAD